MRRTLICLLVAVAPALTGASSTDELEEHSLVRAMTDEVARTVESLSVEDFSVPYYAAFSVFEVERKLCVGRDGGLLQSDRDRVRRVRVDVRVGDWEFDSGNAAFGIAGRGLTPFPADDDYGAVRRNLWLKADQSYKDAAEILEKKRAVADKLQRDPTEVPSFSKIEPVKTAIDGDLQPLDDFPCEEMAERVSGVYGDASDVEGGRVIVSARNVEQYFVDSEGARIYEPDTTAFADGIGRARGDDGRAVKHFFSKVAHRAGELPSIEELVDEAEASVARIEQLRAASQPEFYTGPVLFEGEAAPQLMWRLLAEDLSGTPDPVTNAEASSSDFDPLVARLDRKLFPSEFDVVDDPTKETLNGSPLIGSYHVDHEGARAERVKLVEDGILETLLMSRTPREEIRATTGHGRSLWGRVKATAGNLMVRPSGGLSREALRDRLLEEAEEQGLDHAYIVRLLDNSAMTFNAFGSDSESRAAEGTMTPLVVLRLNQDGSEEVVRGLSVDRPLIRELERIVAWGDEPVVSNYLVGGYTGAFFGRNTSPMPPMGQSISVPSLLFEKLDMPTYGRKKLKSHYLPAPGTSADATSGDEEGEGGS